MATEERTTLDQGKTHSPETSALPPKLRLAFSASGLLLALFLVAHLWLMSSGLYGRSVLSQRLVSLHRFSGYQFIVALLILLPLSFHACVGLWRVASVRPWKNWSRKSSLSLQGAQRGAGVLIALFAVVHLSYVGWALAFEHVGPSFAFDLLVSRLSGSQQAVPWQSLVYLLGVTSVAFHVAHGVWSLLLRNVASLRAHASLWRWAFVAFGLGIFAVGANAVVFYATSSRLLFIPGTSPSRPPGYFKCPGSALVLPPKTTTAPTPTSAASATPSAASAPRRPSAAAPASH